ncbi:MAG: PIN domain-containing protein [Longimicrobiales bacterium]
MIYVFDTSSFIVLENFYPDTFPTFWEHVETLVESGRLISVSEVYKEIQTKVAAHHLIAWSDGHKHIFQPPTTQEMAAVADIFAIAHFQQLISEKQRVKGSPVADPWVIARARVLNGCVVTEETLKPNAAKIPNVCEHFTVDCTNLKGALAREQWRY